ncbi:MAG: hypothetical protein AAFW82_02140 [Pseudomonadota bacterium]
MTIDDVTLSILCWRQRDVLCRTLAEFHKRGILDCFTKKRAFLNELTDADREIAENFGLEAIGYATNTGIFGGVKGLAEACTSEFMLLVENDCPPIVDAETFVSVVNRSVDDMRANDCPVFSLRSRRLPGEKFDRRERYMRNFQLEQPLAERPELASARSQSSWLRRLVEDWRKSKLIGCALYSEEQPCLRHPSVIRKTDNGNFLTSSKYLSWSNNCLLVRADFMRNVIIPRVRTHPSKVTLNGHQDIEGAMKVENWWRKLNVPMGQAEPGPLTHARWAEPPAN